MNTSMEDAKKDRDILFSEKVTAGRRVYYFDVKENSKGDNYIVITESKRIVSGENTVQEPQFEKHKLFLYKEDFDKFTGALESVLSYIKEISS